MKTRMILCSLLLGMLPMLSVQAQQSDSSAATPQVQTTVNVRSEAEALAKGYVAAFPTLRRNLPIYLVLRQHERIVILSSVRSLNASGAVLIVELDIGATYLVNPLDVLNITDAPPPSPLTPPAKEK